MINNPSHAQETFHSTHLGELGRDATGRDDAPAQDGSSHDDAEKSCGSSLWKSNQRGVVMSIAPGHRVTAFIMAGQSSDLFAMQRTRADLSDIDSRWIGPELAKTAERKTTCRNRPERARHRTLLQETSKSSRHSAAACTDLGRRPAVGQRAACSRPAMELMACG